MWYLFFKERLVQYKLYATFMILQVPIIGLEVTENEMKRGLCRKEPVVEKLLKNDQLMEWTNTPSITKNY